MNCTYGISAKLPSFFDRKYFSCSQMCFNRNVVDVCEEDSLKDSLIIETVQGKLQQTLTPLLETAISISSLSERIIKVLENSHLEDAVSLTNHKNVQGRKKMKRRKKRKQRSKCDVIKEDEVHAHRSFTLFENEYLLNNVPKWDKYIPDYYDNTSFSHITSEKESAYSEDKRSSNIVVRKRKKLQRRKKRKQKPKNLLLNEGDVLGGNGISYFHSEDFFTNIAHLDSSVPGKDNLGGYDEDKVFNQITSAKELARRGSQPSDMPNSPVQPIPVQTNCINSDEPSNKDTIFPLQNKNSNLCCEDLLRTTIEQNYISNKIIGEDTKIVDALTTIIDGDTKIIGSDTAIDCDKKIIDGDTFSGKVVGGETFSKEQRRQLRRKMRNVKKRPESYVVLGLI